MQCFRRAGFLLILSCTLTGCGGGSSLETTEAPADADGKSVISSMPSTGGNVDSVKKEGGMDNFGMPK